MRRIASQSFGLGLLCLLLSCDWHPYGFDVYQELSTSSGGRIQVAVIGQDDPGYSVEATVFDRGGKRFPERVVLGFIGEFPLTGVRFALYEAKGGALVGLYRERRPSILLMMAELDERWTLSCPERYEYPERTEGALEELSKAAGRPLKLADDPASEWR